MIRVLIVDDDATTREILRDYLASDSSFEVVGEASDGIVAARQAAALLPDVILMDMQMPIQDGVSATKIIHTAHPEIGILGLSTFSTDRYVVDLIRAGASGYLVKDTLPKDIIAAIHAVVAGESVLSPEVTRHVLRGLESSKPTQVEPDADLIEALSPKELEVIELLAQGLSNREMAEQLFVTESTIKARFVKVMEKLGVRDRVQILVTAVARGLITIAENPQFSPRP